MVVAHQRDHAAMWRGARQVGVAEHVSRTVDPGALAVPDTENAVESPLAAYLRLLGAPQRSCSQIFVDAGLKDQILF